MLNLPIEFVRPHPYQNELDHRRHNKSTNQKRDSCHHQPADSGDKEPDRTSMENELMQWLEPDKERKIDDHLNPGLHHRSAAGETSSRQGKDHRNLIRGEGSSVSKNVKTESETGKLKREYQNVKTVCDKGKFVHEHENGKSKNHSSRACKRAVS